MKKALIVATIGGFICAFEKNDIKLLKNLGYEVFVACNTEGREEELRQLGCKIVHLPIARNPLKKQNIKSYQLLKKLMEKEKFDLVHCHTPVGGVLARLVAKNHRKIGTKVIYTAHGFHFFKGASLINWLVYYPIEKWLSRYTDLLITINHEDFERAKTFNAKKIEYIPGVGVDIEKFSCKTISASKKEKLSKEFEIKKGDVVLLSVGELSSRKNQRVIIEAVSKLKQNNIKYLIVGEGALKEEYLSLIHKYQLEKQVVLTGYRNDINDICALADVFVFPSLQEGLPVALMEAMACGLPVICSDIRGNVDLIENDVDGKIVRTFKSQGYVEAIQELIENPSLLEQYGKHGREKIREFDATKIKNLMNKIYCNVENG